MNKTLNGEKGDLRQVKYHIPFFLKRGVEFLEELYQFLAGLVNKMREWNERCFVVFH